MSKHNQVPQFCVILPILEVNSFMLSTFRPRAIRVLIPNQGASLGALDDAFFSSWKDLSLESGQHDFVNAVTFRLCRVGYKPFGPPGNEVLYVLEDKQDPTTQC